MSKQTPTTYSYFFPDPFDTGESVCVQAESREEALKQLATMKPTAQESPEDAPEAELENTHG